MRFEDCIPGICTGKRSFLNPFFGLLIRCVENGDPLSVLKEISRISKINFGIRDMVRRSRFVEFGSRKFTVFLLRLY